MKINYNKNTTPVDKIPEEHYKKRRWDRWIYLGVLGIILFSFLQWLITPWIFDSAHGILLQQQYDVQFSNDIRVLNYKVNEDDFVKKGDTLFYYENYQGEKQQLTFAQDSINLAIDVQTQSASLIALEGQIEKRKLFITALEKRLAHWKAERVHKEKLVYLNVINVNELATIDRSIDDINYQIESLKAEFTVQLSERDKLLTNIDKNKKMSFDLIGIEHQTKAYLAPITGKVDRLRIPENQICYKTDQVTSIIYPEYFVRAYIEMTDLDEFVVGDDVVVVLPYNAPNLAGVVKKMYSVSELKDAIVYESNENGFKHGIVVEIVPKTKNGWKNLSVSNIPVKIRKGKVNI